MSKVIAMTVERGSEGYWTHPAFDAFCDGREHVPAEEFNQWLEDCGLEHEITVFDQEPESEAYREWFKTGSFLKWVPEPPSGDGWFVGSIHDTEDDGPVCVWFRSIPKPMSTITKEFTKEQLQQIEAAAKEVLWPVVWSEKKAREHFSEKITPEVVLELARIALALWNAKPIAWTDEVELEDMESTGRANIFKSRRAMGTPEPGSVVKLYRLPLQEAKS